MRKLMQRLSGYHRLRWALLAAWLPAFLGMGLIYLFDAFCSTSHAERRP